MAYWRHLRRRVLTGKDVFVVGGGFAAAEESVFLTKYARQVTILIRGDDFTCAQATADAARNHEKITVLTNTEVEEVSGRHFSPLSPVPEYQNRSSDQAPCGGRRDLRRVRFCRL